MLFLCLFFKGIYILDRRFRGVDESCNQLVLLPVPVLQAEPSAAHHPEEPHRAPQRPAGLEIPRQGTHRAEWTGLAASSRVHLKPQHKYSINCSLLWLQVALHLWSETESDPYLKCRDSTPLWMGTGHCNFLLLIGPKMM